MADFKVVAECTFAELQGDPDDDANKPRINTAWKVNEDGEHEGEVYYKDLYLTPNAMKWSLKALRAAGFKGDDVTKCGQIVGNEARIVVGEEEYNGETSLKLKFINKIGGGKPMTGASKLTFAETLKAQIMAAEAGSGDTKEEEDARGW